MADSEHFEGILRQLLGTQRLGVLSTHNQGQPYASLVAFAATENLRELLFATARTTRKYSNLAADPRAAMLIDNRSNLDADLHQATGVTATGRVEEALRTDHIQMAKIYLAKHPHLEDFIGSPTCALLRLKVDCYYMVRRFQSVMELRIEQ